MAHVPTINAPTVLPDGQGLPYQRLDAPVAAFGGNAAALLKEGASTGLQIYQHYQSLADETAANDANTNFRMNAMKLWADYNTKEGKDAVSGLGQYQSQLQSLKDSAFNGLNARQKKLVQPHIDSAFMSLNENGLMYKNRQEKVWNDQSRDSSIAMIGQEAVMMRNDPLKLQSAIDKAMGELRLKAQNNGWSDETFNANAMAVKGKMLGNVIEVTMAEDPLKAKSLFDRFQDQIDPQTRGVIGERLKPKVLSAQADSIVASATAGPPADFNDLWGRLKLGESANQQFNKDGTPLISKPQFSADGKKIANGGAVGISQMLPETARATAQAHNLPWDENKFHLDSAYNEQLGQMHLHDLLRQYGGNAVLAAAAYNAGSGAVDKWLKDYGDPRTGQISNQDFASKIPYEATRKYIDALGLNKSGPSHPDMSMVARVSEATKSDPELQRVAVSRAMGQVHQYQLATEQDRAKLDTQIDNLKSALVIDPTLAIPKDEISRLYEPAKQEKALDDLEKARFAGQLFDGVKNADQATLLGWRNDLQSGKGALSDAVRQKFGITDSEGDKSKEIAIRGQMGELLGKAISARQSQVKSDAGQYAIINDPAVKTAHDKLQGNYTPEGWQDYQTAQSAYQSRIGVPQSEQKLLTTSERAQWIDHILTLPEPKDVATFIRGIRAQTGDSWPQIFKELTTGEGALPKQFQSLALIADGDKVSMMYLADALKMEKDKPGTLRHSIKTDEKNSEAQSIDQSIENAMLNYKLTFSSNAGGTLAAENVQDSAKLLAYAYRAHGMSAGDAANRAVAAFINRYDISVSPGNYQARSPIGLGSKMEDVGGRFRPAIEFDQLRPVTDIYSQPGVHTDEDVKRRTLSEARQGHWVTNDASTGWVLIGKSNNPVIAKDGKPLQLLFEDVKSGKYDKIKGEQPYIGPNGEVLQ